MQTVLAPIVSSALYLLIFGVSLGELIILEGGLSYLAFLVPGLVMMAVLINAYENSSSSVISGKFGGDLEDWRIVPLSPRAILWALSLGGLTRGMVVGFITFMVGECFYYVMNDQFLIPTHWGLLFFFLVLGGLSFAMFGISIAFWARTFDHVTAVRSFVISPLIYLGGVFFTLDGLHPAWQLFSKINPLLYLINGVRYSLLGQSDVPVILSVGVSIISIISLYLIAIRVLRKAPSTPVGKGTLKHSWALSKVPKIVGNSPSDVI